MRLAKEAWWQYGGSMVAFWLVANWVLLLHGGMCLAREGGGRQIQFHGELSEMQNRILNVRVFGANCGGPRWRKKRKKWKKL